MLHIPINLDDLSCENVIILYYKYKVLYGLYQIYYTGQNYVLDYIIHMVVQ